MAKRTSAITELFEGPFGAADHAFERAVRVAGGEEVAHVELGHHPRKLEPEEEGHDQAVR